jgi:hypothetical protein
MYDRICGWLKPNGFPCTNPARIGFCDIHKEVVKIAIRQSKDQEA